MEALNIRNSILLLLLVFFVGGFLGHSRAEADLSEKNLYALMGDFANFTCMTINDSELKYPSLTIRLYNETATPSLKVKCKKNEVWFDKYLVLPRVN